METGQKGINLIKKYEGLALKAYLCPANVLTIGYGHTGKDVIPDMQINEVTAEQILKRDLEKFEKAVDRLVTSKINQNQFDALVSFTFNLGEGNLKSSTLLNVFAVIICCLIYADKYRTILIPNIMLNLVFLIIN